jgi:beta-lactamase regulating signal transducer with metallopeptidase domain
MRTTIALFMLISIFNFIISTPVFAITSAKNRAINPTIKNQHSDLKRTFNAQKQMLKLEHFLHKKDININNSTDKWLWYGLGFLALSVVMSVLPVVRGFAGLIGLIGVILIIYWLIKKLGI